MGKKKNKNKVSGAAKTAAKTEKNQQSKLKKKLADLEEEDIAKVVAEIELEEAQRTIAAEKALKEPPSARAYATLTPHPINNELIIFGGEYHNGRKTEVYNDLILYNPVTNQWRKIKAPGAPTPRSAHQTIARSANKGEVWVFGGEYTSPSETQFYHYKDLWCFSLAGRKWEKVVAPNGPSPRSGHRMVLLGHKLLIFGGYCDNGRDTCRYFDDVYAFCLDTRTWEKLNPSGKGPSPRSACVMLPSGSDSLIVYGGFSRVRDGKTQRTITYTDMFRLSVKKDGWAWRSLPSGERTARAGVSAAVNVHSNKAYVFGGVNDVEETEEDIYGQMSDELSLLDLETGKWHSVTLQTEEQESTPTQHGESSVSAPSKSVKVILDEVFTSEYGININQNEPMPSIKQCVTNKTPAARMSTMLAVHRSVLYLYGGVLEKNDQQYYLNDMYSLDLHKPNKWKTIVHQHSLPDWLGSDSDDWGTEDGSDLDDDSISSND